MTNRHYNFFKLSVFILYIFLTSCAVLKTEKTFSKKGLTVTFRSINALDDVKHIRFLYPIILSEKQVLNQLLSLWHNNIVSPGKAKPVFSIQEGAKLAPLFKKALKKVEMGKYLNFEFQSSKGLIEGQVFATAKKIHWRFLKINNKMFSNDPLRIRKPTWQLILIPGQKYQKLQSGGYKKIIKNRIIVDINIPFPKQRFQSKPTTNRLPNNLTRSEIRKLKLRRQLSTLKKFLDENLIDKSEYEKKKELLMNKYFEIID
jgi:hypothetical protein